MITLSVCIGSACHLKGSYKVITEFQRLIKENNAEDRITLKGAFCLGHCAKAVAVKIEEEDEIFSVSPQTAEEFFNKEVMTRLSVQQASMS